MSQTTVDTIFLTNGVVIGEISIGNTQDFVTVHSQNRQTISANQVERISFADGREAVAVYLASDSRSFLAEKIYEGVIDVFVLNLRQRGRLYYMRKDNRVTSLHRGNLENFYSVYFDNCYDQIPEKKFGYNQKDMLHMARQYQACFTGDIESGISLANEVKPRSMTAGIRFGLSRNKINFKTNAFLKNVVFDNFSLEPYASIFFDYEFSGSVGVEVSISKHLTSVHADSLSAPLNFGSPDTKIDLNLKNYPWRLPAFIYYYFRTGPDIQLKIGPQAFIGYTPRPKIHSDFEFNNNTLVRDYTGFQTPGDELGLGIRGSVTYENDSRISASFDVSYMRVASNFLFYLGGVRVDLDTDEIWFGFNLVYYLN